MYAGVTTLVMSIEHLDYCQSEASLSFFVGITLEGVKVL